MLVAEGAASGERPQSDHRAVQWKEEASELSHSQVTAAFSPSRFPRTRSLSHVLSIFLRLCLHGRILGVRGTRGTRGSSERSVWC